MASVARPGLPDSHLDLNGYGIDQRCHAIHHALLEPRLRHSSIFLKALDHDLIVSVEERQGARALGTPLPKQRDRSLESIGTRSLHRRIETFGEPLHVDATTTPRVKVTLDLRRPSDWCQRSKPG